MPAEALRRLAEIDRRNRTEHLTAIARIEVSVWAESSRPSRPEETCWRPRREPESYEFFAQLCFGLGRARGRPRRPAPGRARNPAESGIVLRLAETLAGQYQTEEAIEMYWRAFDRAEDLDHKLEVGPQAHRALPPAQPARPAVRTVAVKTGTIRGPGEETRGRDVAMCSRRPTLPRATWEAPRRAREAAGQRYPRHAAAQQLSKLAEEDGDLETAARYQKLTKSCPGRRRASATGNPAGKSGDFEEAQAVWSKSSRGEKPVVPRFPRDGQPALERKTAPCARVTEGMLRADPHNWEALYRQGWRSSSLAG